MKTTFEVKQSCGDSACKNVFYASADSLLPTSIDLAKDPASGQDPALTAEPSPLIQPVRAGRTKNQIQKSATVHHLKKSGKWAVLVTLVEPRELEGKMRSGRQKFERQTQSLANDLGVEINNCLFGKELARQLSPHEIELAKKLFWELLEPKHPDWIENLDELVGFCERARFRIARQRIPTVAEAVKIYWREHVIGLEKETLYNTRRAIAFLLPAFGHLKPVEMTDQLILEPAHGKEPVPYMKTIWPATLTPEEIAAGLWKTLAMSRSKRPWSPAFLRIFLTRARAFKNWMHASKDPLTGTVRDWCPLSQIETPNLEEMTRIKNQQAADSNQAADWECQQKPALTIPQVQALIDVAWVAWGGKYAPFYVHALWCGSRSKEIRRTSTESFNSKDGVLLVPAAVAKTDKGRESQLTTGWGGNSPDIFKEFYKRLVTKDEARQFWMLLPTWLTRKHPITINLPAGHKLDSAMTPGVVCGVSAAGAAMDELHAGMEQAQKNWEAKDKELKSARKAINGTGC